MSKKWKQIFCVFLSALMLCSIAVATQTDVEQENKVTTEIEDYEDRIQELREKSKDVSERLFSAQEEMASEQEQKALLDERCGIITQQINLIEDNVARIEARIEENEEKEQLQLDRFKKRVRMEEESGITSYLSVLFNATSFADFISRMEFLNELAEYNHSVINGLRETREELERDKELVSEGLAELEEARRELQEQIDFSEEIISAYKTTTEALQAEFEMLQAEEGSTTELLRAATAMAVQLGINDIVSSAGGYTWPTSSVREVTSNFGYRQSPGGFGSTNHLGVDLATPLETKVYAAKAGYVTYAGWNGGYGYCVIVQHGAGNATLYGHLNSISCNVGDPILQGDLLGYSGNTGASTGPHLHFGIMENNQWIDPLTYLTGSTYVGS